MKQFRKRLPQCRVIDSDRSNALLSLRKPGKEAGSIRGNHKVSAFIEAGAKQVSKVKS